MVGCKSREREKKKDTVSVEMPCLAEKMLNWEVKKGEKIKDKCGRDGMSWEESRRKLIDVD